MEIRDRSSRKSTTRSGQIKACLQLDVLALRLPRLGTRRPTSVIRLFQLALCLRHVDHLLITIGSPAVMTSAAPKDSLEISPLT